MGTAPATNFSNLNDEPIGRWGMALLILLPFLVLGSRVTSDLTASLCALFLAAFWFMRSSFKQDQRTVLKQQTWFKAFLLLWLFMCVTSIFSADPKYVLVQAIIDIRWPAFALVVSCVILSSERRLQIFEKSALVLLAFIVFDTIFQYFYGQDILGHVPPVDSKRLTGPFTKLVPGNYALRIYPMALLALLVISRQLPKPKFLALMVFTAGLSQFFAFLTGERVVFVLFGLVNTALIVALVYQEKLSYRFVLTSLTGFIIVAASSVMLFPKMFQRTIVSLFYQITHFQEGTSYPIFVTAHYLWQQTPWVGVGTRYFYQSCMALPTALQPHANSEGCLVHPHHIYLEWVTQNGVLGLALFIVVLYFIFKTLWQNLDFKGNLLQSTVVFIALVMMFNPITPSMSIQTNNFAGEAWLLVGWALARALVSGRKLQANQAETIKSSV